MLSDALQQALAQAVAKYPEGRQASAVMAALALVQQERGWLSPASLEEVAEYLNMAPIAVYEVASFYSMYRLQPQGRHSLAICTNVPCMLTGDADKVAQYLKTKLGIEFGQTTADGRFTLLEYECMGACGDAPVILHNNTRLCPHMSVERIDQLIDSLP